MATLHFHRREVEAKVVYCGPALSGKTTNLRVLHRLVPSGQRGDLHELATDQDRTLFFDFIPVDLGEIGEYAARFKLYSVPGQVYYRETRRVVLQGADAVVFVADSSPDRLQANVDALADLIDAMRSLGLDRGGVPIIVQLNKRDVEGALAVPHLVSTLGVDEWPRVEAVAAEGHGVLRTLHAACDRAADRIRQRLAGDERGAQLRMATPGEAEDELEEVDRMLEEVLEVRPGEVEAAERQKVAERGRPDDVEGFLMEYVDRSAEGDDGLGATDPGFDPATDEEAVFAAARPGAGRKGEALSRGEAPVAEPPPAVQVPAAGGGEVVPLPTRRPVDPASVREDARPTAPSPRDIAPVAPVPEVAEDTELERTVPQGRPTVPLGPPLDAQVDPDAFGGATLREVLGFSAGADGLPVLELVLERGGSRRRHPVRLTPRAPHPPVGAGAYTGAILGALFGVVGLALGLGLGWWLFA